MSDASPARLASVAITSQKTGLARSMTDGVYAALKIDPLACRSEDRQKSERDIGYHLEYLIQALWAEDPILFTNYVSWANILFTSLKFSPQVLAITLQVMHDVLAAELRSDLAGASCTYVQLGLQEARAPITWVPSYLAVDSPLTPLATDYLARLLAGQRRPAIQLILEAADHGVAISDLYLEVFQPVQREIGRLWQMNQITVGQEHFATAVTQFAIAQLYPRIFAAEKTGRRVVATGVGGEQHEMGISMVANFFELSGWETFFYGANTPTDSVVRAIIDHDADLVAISATITVHIQKVAALVGAIRALAHPPKVLVGGQPFNISANLWQVVGADATATDALAAVQVGELLTAGVCRR